MHSRERLVHINEDSYVLNYVKILKSHIQGASHVNADSISAFVNVIPCRIEFYIVQ